MSKRKRCSISIIVLFLFVVSRVVAMDSHVVAKDDKDNEIGVCKIHYEKIENESMMVEKIENESMMVEYSSILYMEDDLDRRLWNIQLLTQEYLSEFQRKPVSNHVKTKIAIAFHRFWRFLFTIAFKMIKWGVFKTHDVIKLIVRESNTLLVFYLCRLLLKFIL